MLVIIATPYGTIRQGVESVIRQMYPAAQFQHVETGEAVVQLMKDNLQPTIIVCDQYFAYAPWSSKIKGAEVARQIREILADNTPFVLNTLDPPSALHLKEEWQVKVSGHPVVLREAVRDLLKM